MSGRQFARRLGSASQDDLCFTRYADDFNIFVRSQRAADRVMRTGNRSPGIRMCSKPGTVGVFLYLIQIHPKSIKRLKERVRQLTGRSSGFALSMDG